MINSLKIECNDVVLRPSRAHGGDAGLDLRASEACKVLPGLSTLVGTGIKVEIPHGFVGLVFSRSGMAKYGVTLANAVGVIDASYRGEIKVFLTNHSKINEFSVERGARIAQLVIVPCALPDLEFVEKVTESIRGEGGFGSTGVV